MSISVESISQRAGVGRSTAYRVLNDDPKVSDSARRRVMQAITELGYPRMRPNGKRRRGLMLWLPGLARSLAGAYVVEVVDALEGVLARRRRGLRVVSRPLPASPDELPLELLREDFAGILTVAFYSDRHLATLGQRWPVVCLLSSRQVPGVACVGPDYSGAARLAVEHLLSRGHQRIGLITGRPLERNFSRMFLDGYSGAMVQAGLGAEPRLVHSDGRNLGKGPVPEVDAPGERAARELLSGEGRPTAIIARHDSMTGLLRVVEGLGLRIPEDVSVIGCGARGLSGVFGGSLTTVTFDAEQMAELGLEIINSVPTQGARVLVPVELREGDSVRSLN